MFINVTECVDDADIAFVIDNSGSIRDNNVGGIDNWELILDLVTGIISAFEIGPNRIRVAVIDFGIC